MRALLKTVPLLLALFAAPPHAFAETRLSSGLAESQLSFNFARCIAVGEGRSVHVVWFDSQIRYRRSIDDGRSWLAPVTLSAPDGRSEQAAIAVAGRAVYVAWHELRGTLPQIVFRRSLDGGATWEPEQRLTDASIHSAHPSIAATGARVHVTWFDGRHGEVLPEIYTRHSRDGGATWQQEQRISESNAPSWVSTIEANGLDVFIGWVDYLDANEEEYLRRSVDGGETWLPAVRMTSDPADSWAPSIALSGRAVHFAWFDRRHAEATDVDMELKLNEALTLVGLPASPPPPRTPENYYLNAFAERIQTKKQQLIQVLPQWVAMGGDPKKVEAILRDYERLEQAWSEGWEIYTKRSADGGESFGADTRLTFAAGASNRPSIFVRGDDVGVVWFDFRDHASEIYAKFSSDGGATWSGDVRLTSSGAAVLASAARSSEALHVVWRDSRLPTAQVYYSRIPLAGKRRAARP
ncbi:MAG: sialidase family protein [Acidobacteriota bacterium]